MADEAGDVRAQVANARAEDVGRGVARVGAAVLQSLGLQEGQPIEIIGKRHMGIVLLFKKIARIFK